MQGGKLSKQVLQCNNNIKKLRAKEKETSELNKTKRCDIYSHLVSCISCLWLHFMFILKHHIHALRKLIYFKFIETCFSTRLGQAELEIERLTGILKDRDEHKKNQDGNFNIMYNYHNYYIIIYNYNSGPIITYR